MNRADMTPYLRMYRSHPQSSLSPPVPPRPSSSRSHRAFHLLRQAASQRRAAAIVARATQSKLLPATRWHQEEPCSAMLAPSWVHLAAGLAATYPGAVSWQACTAPLVQASLEAALQALQSQWPPSRHDCCDASAVAFLAHASCFFPPGGADVPLSSAHRCDASHASALRFSASCGSSPWRARFPCARLARALHV